MSDTQPSTRQEQVDEFWHSDNRIKAGATFQKNEWKHGIIQHAQTPLNHTVIVLCHVVQNDRDTSQIWSHITARHLITRSRAAKFQTSTLNVWYSAKHTARAAWWIRGSWGWSAKSATEAAGAKVKLHSLSSRVNWCAFPLAWAARPPWASAQQGREFLNNRVITLIDTCLLLNPGTEQHKAGISKSSNSAKHTEAWWILVPSQTHQGRSSLIINWLRGSMALESTFNFPWSTLYSIVYYRMMWYITHCHITARHVFTRSRAAKFYPSTSRSSFECLLLSQARSRSRLMNSSTQPFVSRLEQLVKILSGSMAIGQHAQIPLNHTVIVFCHGVQNNVIHLTFYTLQSGT